MQEVVLHYIDDEPGKIPRSRQAADILGVPVSGVGVKLTVGQHTLFTHVHPSFDEKVPRRGFSHQR
jgi:hypothetical protein